MDTAQDDVYGFAANLAARMCSLAEPGTVAVSQAVEQLTRSRFELKAQLPKAVKGVDQPVRYFLVVAERDLTQTPAGPLVGRETEFAYLQQAWAQASVGELRTAGVVFVGEAGIGKSRLAWSAVEMAERSHGVVLQLIGSPFYTDVGLRPVRRLLERRCGIGRTSQPEERLRHLRRELEERSLDPATSVPLLAPVLGIGPETGYSAVPAEGRKLYQQITGAVHEYLMACSRDAPTLILVEDMHWFDEDTFDVVGSLLDADLGGHVLVVMTNRNRMSLPDVAKAQLFELQPLGDDEADQLITALHPGVSAEEQRAIRQRCVGIPLYIEEVVAKLKEQPSDASNSHVVPDTLYEALFARLRSRQSAVQVVEAAAIIGSRIERGLLLSVLDLPEGEVDAVIDELVSARVLESLSQQSFRFRHELLREVAEELSPPTLRRSLHSRIADGLASTQGNPDWPLIARHYERAERFSEAASAYAAAAANARLRGALREALTYLAHAISQAERCPSGGERDRLEIALRLGRAFLAQAAEGVASQNAAADFERCLALCSSDLADDDLFSTVMSLYPYYTMRADLDRAERLVRSVRAQLTGPRECFLPINEFGLGMLAWYRGEFGYAHKKLEVAANTLTEACTRDLEAMLFMPNDATAGLYTHLALARYIDGDLAGVAAELDRAEQRCAEIPFPKGAFSLAYARQMELLIRLEAGQLQPRRRGRGRADYPGRATRLRFLGAGRDGPAGHSGRRIGLGGQCRSGDVAATRSSANRIRRGVASDGHNLARHLVRRHLGTPAHCQRRIAEGTRALTNRAGVGRTNQDALLRRGVVAAASPHHRRHRGTPRGSRGGHGVGPASGCADLPATRRDRSFRARRCTGPARGIGRAEWVFRREHLAGSRARPGNARVRRPGGKVAIIGGGMAALSAAWRLSEPGFA